MRRTGSASTLTFLLVVLVAACPAGAAVPAEPIPEGPESGQPPQFIGAPAQPRPVSATLAPRHPYMAENGRSNIHDDAYMSGAYEFSGPLGRNMERLSTFQSAECASVTFDRKGRIVSI